MTDQANQTAFHHYRRLIQAAIAAQPLDFQAASESPTTIQVERGLVYPAALLNPRVSTDFWPLERLIDLLKTSPPQDIAVIDRAGHRRPVYRPLLAYSAIQSLHLLHRTNPNQIFPWADALLAFAQSIQTAMSPATLIDGCGETIPAARGSDAALEVWSALALDTAGRFFDRPAWCDLADRVMTEISRRQTPAGTFLAATPADNPETHWYHELLILHAVASFSAGRNNPATSAATLKNAAFHLHETQPDHATTQPWALFAFVWHRDTRPLADQILHNAQTLASSALSSILLADALYSLRLCSGPLS